jgi:hypothetical protein
LLIYAISGSLIKKKTKQNKIGTWAQSKLYPSLFQAERLPVRRLKGLGGAYCF